MDTRRIGYLRHLKYFIAVAKHMSFAKAARQLHISGPPLSRRIQQLEEELGARLFLRDRRRQVALTDAGRLLLRQAAELIAQAADVSDNVHRAHAGKTRLVKIGMAYGLARTISRMLVAYGKYFPGVEMRSADILSDDQPAALREHRIDVGFLYWVQSFADEEVECEFLFKENLMVCLSRDHKVATHNPRRLYLKDIAHLPVLLSTRDISGGLHDRILVMYQRAGLTPKILLQETLVQYPVRIAVGEGFGIAPKSISTNDSQIRSVPLAEPDAYVEARIAWRRHETSPVVRSFLETARKFYATASDSDPLGAKISIKQGKKR